MKNIHILKLDKYNDSKSYEVVENGVYRDLNDPDDTNIRIAFSFELEDGENDQYPIEDVLDKYNLHVSDFLESEKVESPNILKIELAGELDEVRKAATIAGKRVYNKDVVGEDGKTHVDLIIE